MKLCRIHYSDETGYFIAHNNQMYKPMISTKFDEGDSVEVIGPEYSSSYVVVRSTDRTIVEDWRDIDT